MSAVSELIAIAEAEEGYLEKASSSQLDDKTANAGSANYTKYARDLDAEGDIYNGKKQGYAWCDVFVDWCFYTAFGKANMMSMLYQSYNGAGAGCTYSMKYFKNNSAFYSSPEAGDQIFFTKDGGSTSNHTGIVRKVTSSKVYTVEGNTSSASGVVANGGCVRLKSYDLSYSKIAGYGRPDWSVVAEIVSYQATVTASTLNVRSGPSTSYSIIGKLSKGDVVTVTRESGDWGYASAKGGWCSLTYLSKISETAATTATTEVSGGDEEMTVEDFQTLMKEYRATLQDNDSSSYSEDARTWAQENGLVQGSTDGEFNGMWEDFMTREQFVTVLYRFAQMIGQA